MTVHCAKCNHQWEVSITLPMPMDRFVRALGGAAAAGCPACGAHDDAVLCGPSSPARRVTETAPGGDR
ncbi:MAG: hypothetical protein AB7P99_04830 [Vicinamibacterales bacterium]